jgi:hypothetical protein
MGRKCRLIFQVESKETKGFSQGANVYTWLAKIKTHKLIKKPTLKIAETWVSWVCKMLGLNMMKEKRQC